MYRLLEKSGQPTNEADTRQEHPPTKRPRKGETGQGSLREARWRKPPAMICWEASDQHGKAKRHSFGSGVLCVWQQRIGATWPWPGFLC
jgi:hypothetical protein